MKYTKIDYGTKKFKMYPFEEVVAINLPIFGQGMKVTCEITLMAADSGLGRTDEDVIAVGWHRQGSRYCFGVNPG